ncbi:hypothetical protein [Symbiopectobacterium sp. RP]|uniref:hypothetical protein n=1 Tax=Symbiopectobacterium sp. RP TaxID=3248553 RepID=UPI003D2A2B9E
MITASYAFLPHIRVSVVIIFKSVCYNSNSFTVNAIYGNKGAHASSSVRYRHHT